MSSIVLRDLAPSDAGGVSAIVEDVYRRSYVDTIGNDPFRDPAAFMSRFASHVRAPEFTMIMAWRGDEAVGQAWGWGEHEEWQQQLDSALPPAEAAELSGPSFAIAEIMTVKPRWNTGIARTLHDALLGRRPESIATLFVDPHNARAYERYVHWGWWRVGTSTPRLPHAPTFDVLAHLRTRRRRASSS